MSLNCPKCGLLLKVRNIRRHFVCPNCATKLKGYTTGPEIAGIAIWILADFVIYPAVHMALGFGWPAHAVRIVISGCFGFASIWMFTSVYGRVDLDDKPKVKDI